MAKNKQTDSKTEEKQALEAKVDAMMDSSPKAAISPVEGKADGSSEEPLDIFAETESPIEEEQPAIIGAPLLPGKPSKAASVSESSVEPAPSISKSKNIEPIAPEQFPDAQPAETIDVKPLNIDTPQTDAAIDDIVAQEADEVLAAQDAGIEAAVAAAEPLEDAPKKHGHPIFWFIILLLVIAALLTAYVLTSPGLNLPFGA